jgi:hypothetical protein
MSVNVAVSPGDVDSRRTFGQKLKTATWQYAICVFGGMFVVLVYAVVKRFPALGAAAAALIFCMLLALLYAVMKALLSEIGAKFTHMRPEHHSRRPMFEILTALKAFVQLIK